jgi:hypothetical protein
MKVKEANRKSKKVFLFYFIVLYLFFILAYNWFYSVFNEAYIIVYFFIHLISGVIIGIYSSIIYSPLEQRKLDIRFKRSEHYINRCKYYLSTNEINKAIYFYDNGIRHIKTHSPAFRAEFYGYLMAKLNREI